MSAAQGHTAKALAASFASGGLFAVGLGLSGMTKPSKVVGFLDPLGAWDASLAFVMVGAIAVYASLARWITRRRAPLYEPRFHLPTRRELDARLLLGAAIFGVGWGLAGYCPGPSLVATGAGSLVGLAFVVSMAVGMKLEHVVTERGSRIGKRAGSLVPGREGPRGLEESGPVPEQRPR